MVCFANIKKIACISIFEPLSLRRIECSLIDDVRIKEDEDILKELGRTEMAYACRIRGRLSP